MLLAAFTLVHVVISLVGIGAGLVVMAGLLGGRERRGWTALFLVTTVATSVTGFGFPVDHLLPSHVVGVVSLVVLAVAIFARYGAHLAGAWRWVFVGVFQAFLKVPGLHALAPHQSEPPFLVTQVVVLVLFVVLTVSCAKRFRGDASVASDGSYREQVHGSNVVSG